MTGTVLTTFASFSTDSGASKEMAALMKIKESLAANRMKSVPAPGGPPAATPGFTISGDDAMDAIIRGIAQLGKDLCDREAAVVGTIESVEELIQTGMDKLNRLATQITTLLPALEKKDADRKAESERQG